MTDSPALTTRRHVVLAVLIAVALLFAYRDALLAMERMWATSPMYSYGYTVPFVSMYLLWSRRGDLRGLTPQPSMLAGIAMLLASVALLTAGRAGGIQVLEQIAFLVSIAACVLLLLGRAYLRVGWAALAYLLLMVPIWDGLTEPLHHPFQLRSAAIGLTLLRWIGVPAHGEGTVLALPGITLEVAPACSGVNYLVAVIALGLPLVYLYVPGFWRRVLLLITAVTIAALSNGLRVALIGVLAYYEFSSALHGPGHMLHGLFVAAIGYVVLFVGVSALAPRGSSDDHTPGCRPSPITRANRGASSRTMLANAGALVAVFVLLGSNVFARNQHPVALGMELQSFPVELGPWVADVVVPRSQAAAELWPGADTRLARTYRRADGSVVDVYIAYFAVQRENKEIVSYRTFDLHSKATTRPLPNVSLNVNYTPSGVTGRPTMFWYSFDGGPQTSRYLVKAQTIWRAFWLGRSNGAAVVLSVPSATINAIGAREPALDPERYEELLRGLAPLVEEALHTRLTVDRAAKL